MEGEGTEGIVLTIQNADIDANVRIRKPQTDKQQERKQIERLLIADRGAGGTHIVKTAKRLGIHTVVVYTSSDELSLHVTSADEAVRLPDGLTYGDWDQIIKIAQLKSCDGVITGLTRDASFARKVVHAGLVWVGPGPEAIEAFASRQVARNIAQDASVPVLPGKLVQANTEDDILRACEETGYPVILKAAVSGPNTRPRPCLDQEDAKRYSKSLNAIDGGNVESPNLLIERYLSECHFVEVQIFGDGQGKAIAFGERECSVQRKFEPIIAECPSPLVQKDPSLREKLCNAAVSIAESVKYASVGTVKFLVDGQTSEFYFSGLDTGLSVDFPVTELCYDVDLVELMVNHANAQRNGEVGTQANALEALPNNAPMGVAIGARVYAEDVSKDFAPCTGTLTDVHLGELHNGRLDTWIKPGAQVSAAHDGLLATVMNHAKTRVAAIKGMEMLLNRTEVSGTQTNLDLLISIVNDPTYQSGRTQTTFLQDFVKHGDDGGS